ncbi:hypothetical protein HELRODRAFT_179517 [Helobdella robusta]|uniref:Endonuclease/exonuclease/phosphatase domain-containing protein n=1 Tax=Helobdella robusta TaxID=6412 RepID=T1FEU0_HELRO|nr:hypothetical protein HELRODRAFT_179517 [Helobdella robusta]ESN95440.1 hypothetical protein HELRODRAFT_179517 [Helobdella robusta]
MDNSLRRWCLDEGCLRGSLEQLAVEPTGPSNQSIQQTVATNPPHLDVHRVFVDGAGHSGHPASLPSPELNQIQVPQRSGFAQYSGRCRTCYNWHHLNNYTTNINGYYYCNNCPPPSTKSDKSTAPIDATRRPTPTSTSSNNNYPRDKPSTTQPTNAGRLNFLQLNHNGSKNKHDKIQQYLIDHNIHIATLQESKLSKVSKMPVLIDYAIYRKDRGNGRRGGLTTLIHNSIPFSIMSLPDTPAIES